MQNRSDRKNEMRWTKKRDRQTDRESRLSGGFFALIVAIFKVEFLLNVVALRKQHQQVETVEFEWQQHQRPAKWSLIIGQHAINLAALKGPPATKTKRLARATAR